MTLYACGVTRRIRLLLSVLLAGSISLGVPRAQQPAAFPLDELTIAQLQDALTRGQYTSRQLVELYSQRIEALDRSGPTLRSIIEVNPEETPLSAVADASFRSASGELLPKLVAGVLAA